MGQADAAFVNAATPLFLNKKEYRATRLDDVDIAELDEWVQVTVIQRATKALTEDMPATLREEVLRSAHREAATLTWMGGQGAKILATVDGMARLVWQMLKKSHPDLTPDFVRQEMIKDKDGNVKEANRVFNRFKDAEKDELVADHKKNGKEGKKARKNRHKGR
jgi:hypothetical protein